MSKKFEVVFADMALALRALGADTAAAAIQKSGISLTTAKLVAALVTKEVKHQNSKSEREIGRVIDGLIKGINEENSALVLSILLDCARFYQGIGKHTLASRLSQDLLGHPSVKTNEAIRRRLHNALGAFYLDSANYQLCLEHLEIAIDLARKLEDEIAVAACLANAMSALKELGHYQDAIATSKYVFALTASSPSLMFLKFQCAGNGLFCAHRLHDPALALKFLEIGNGLLNCPTIDAVSKATYEYYRSSYLIDTFDHETAEDSVVAACRVLDADSNPRIGVLLRIPEALCKWASRTDEGVASARRSLQDLYEETKVSRLYHDDVLRALMKVFGNAIDHQGAKLGMRYAKELVEFTTGVKRAKFYRQLSDRGVHVHPAPPRVDQPFDPFANARAWLAPSTRNFVAEESKDVSCGPDTPKRQVEKHEELAAIHDDIARLRTEAILKEIRTVAYDTAENWAIAAEFFDDQTGQHCFRVGHLAGMLAREIGLEPGYCARIEHAARLHDIGKIGVNEMILLKPGPLDPSELTAMRAHAEVGAFMLSSTPDPVLQMAAVIAKHHHEWWNGAGYPSSLADRRIPLAARICALADVYDALTHARPYKGAWSHRVAVEEMLSLAGVQFDPHLMRPFLRVLERYVPALSAGRLPGLDHLETNGLIASRMKLMQTIGCQD